jgi:hypothetical protein
MGWDRGEVITVKHVFGGEVRFAQAAIVVEETASISPAGGPSWDTEAVSSRLATALGI